MASSNFSLGGKIETTERDCWQTNKSGKSGLKGGMMVNEELKVILTTMHGQFWCLLQDETGDDLMLLARLQSKGEAMAFCNSLSSLLHCIVLDAPDWVYVPRMLKKPWEMAKAALWPYVPEGRIGEKLICKRCGATTRSDNENTSGGA